MAAVSSRISEPQVYLIEQENIPTDYIPGVKIPIVIISKILSYLDLPTFIQCNTVCQNWRHFNIIQKSAHLVWKQHFPLLELAYRENLEKLYRVNPEQLTLETCLTINHQWIATERGLGRVVGTFFDEVMNESGSGLFTCIFAKNPDFSITLRVGVLARKSVVFNCIFTEELPQFGNSSLVPQHMRLTYESNHQDDPLQARRDTMTRIYATSQRYSRQVNTFFPDAAHYNVTQDDFDDSSDNKVSLRWRAHEFKSANCEIVVNGNPVMNDSIRNIHHPLLFALGKVVHKGLTDNLPTMFNPKTYKIDNHKPPLVLLVCLFAATFFAIYFRNN